MQRSRFATFTRICVAVVFGLLIVLSPSIHFIPYIEPHDCQRIIQLALLVLVLLNAILMRNSSNSIPINTKIKLGFFAILGLAISSTVISIEPSYAIIEVTVFIALCYFALFVACIYREAPEIFIKHLVYALWVSIVLYMVGFYVGYVSAMAVGKQLVWPHPFYGFSNIRLFQQYQLWGLGLIALPLLTFDLKKSRSILLYVALSGWWVLLLYAASRGVTLGWIIALIATAIVYKKQAWPLLQIQLITATIGLIAYFLLFKLVPVWLAPTVANVAGNIISHESMINTSTIFRDTTYDRLDLWKVAYVMIKNFPLLGVGPMHFYFYNSFSTHPHNSVLQLASEWGLPATMIILWIMGYSALCWYKHFNPSKLQTESKLNANLAIILFFTIVANGTYSLVEGVIVMPISQILMFTMIGLMIGQYISGRWFPITPEIPKRLHFRQILAGITLVFLVWSVMPELTRGLTSYNRVLQPGERAFAMAPNTINPRIWMQQRRAESHKPVN